MITDELIEMLCYKGEGNDLDYKAERYKFIRASDDDKSEMLKDILAFANSFRSNTAYILMGFKENPPSPAYVHGLDAEGAIDDSRLQQFVNEKLESKLEFKYEERLYKGMHVAIISIPKQQRPFYLKKDYGKLTKDTVYIRRGSSTSIATPREIMMMGQEISLREEAKVNLILNSSDNVALTNVKEMRIPIFPENLPDYNGRSFENGTYFLPGASLRTNKNYWRQLVKHISYGARAIVIRITIENESTFSLSNLYLELTCESELKYEFLSSDKMPTMPEEENLLDISRISSSIRKDDKLQFDNRGPTPVVRADLGNVLPNQKKNANFDLIFLPSTHGDYELKFSLYANELPKPHVGAHPIKIIGDTVEVTFEMLRERFS